MTIYEATAFAKEKHKGQVDDDGNDYFEFHVKHVFNILKQVTLDDDILSAAILHDTLEDTKTTFDEIREEFGIKIANLVHEVTHEGKPDSKGFYFPRLESKDAILIKFADRLSNLSRMNSWTIARQKHYLRHSKFWRSE